MSPSLNPGGYQDNRWWARDVCLVRRYYPKLNDIPTRGDVVVARSPDKYGTGIVKRIIGLEGDCIKSTDGHIVKVPKGHCFLEGDNRDRSFDSNSYGPVPVNLIEWRAMYVLFPKSGNLSRFLSPLSREDKPARRTGEEEYFISQRIAEKRIVDQQLTSRLEQQKLIWEIEQKKTLEEQKLIWENELREQFRKDMALTLYNVPSSSSA